jgi:carbonic anhydrase
VYKFETGDVFAFNPETNQFLPLEDFDPGATKPDHTLPPI